MPNISETTTSNIGTTVTAVTTPTGTVIAENQSVSLPPEILESMSIASEVQSIQEQSMIDLSETETSIENEEIVADSTFTLLEEEEIEEIIESDISSTEEVSVITTLPIEEVVTETTAITNSIEQIPVANNYEQYIKYGGVVALAVVGAVIMKLMNRKKSKKSDSTDTLKATKKTAKELDAERLGKHKKKKEKKKKNKKMIKLINKRTTLQTIPYKQVLGNDIFLLEGNKYSKAYTIQDINYNLGDADEQNGLLENYSKFLNSLDDTIECQITTWNSKINVKDFEKTVLVDEVDDKFNYLRQEYNEILKNNISKGQNAIHKQIIITLTVTCIDETYAKNKFKTLDLALKNNFNRMGSTELKVLTAQERLELIKDFYRGTDIKIPQFTAEDFKKGFEKLYISPDYFEFKPDYFTFGYKYAKCIFIKEFPTACSDSIITDLIDSNLDIMVTNNIIAYDPAKAKKLVQRQITAIDTNMAQREMKAAQHGNFSSQMPVKIKNQIDSFKQIYEMITTEDQKLFKMNTIIILVAENYDELKTNQGVIGDVLKRNGCNFSEMKWQQEDGMIDGLPIGYQGKFEWTRNFPTESISALQPFNVKEVQQFDGVYYGLNKLSNNIITFNKVKSLINPSGFILGCPGSGKSFSAKREMLDVFLRKLNADIIIIDPEREYGKLVEKLNGTSVKISLGSKSYINPFEFDLALLNDEDVDVICDKCSLLTSFISVMDPKHPLTPQQVSFIDRCVRKTYIESNFLNSFDSKDMPTLRNFRDVMANETENVDEKMKNNLLLTLELYVDGSAKYFSNQTNVDANSRVVSFDIKEVTGIMKTQAMLLVLDNIWNRLSANRDLGRETWIYIDEIYLLFKDEYCLDFLQQLYKRARKYGGVLTGITQNVEDLLRDDKCRTMLSNSEFLYLLKQSPSDIIKLQDTLHFTESELYYVRNVSAGEGLMILGGKDKLPVYDQFPKDTELYRTISTSFSETAALINSKNEEEKELTTV